jgi:hypothetical protein
MHPTVLEDDPVLGRRCMGTEMGEERSPCPEYLDRTSRQSGKGLQTSGMEEEAGGNQPADQGAAVWHDLICPCRYFACKHGAGLG